MDLYYDICVVLSHMVSVFTGDGPYHGVSCMYCALTPHKKGGSLPNVGALDRSASWVELVYDRAHTKNMRTYVEFKKYIFARKYSLIRWQRQEPPPSLVTMVFLIIDQSITYALKSPTVLQRNLGTWMILICLHPCQSYPELSTHSFQNLSVLTNRMMKRKQFIHNFLSYMHNQRHTKISLSHIQQHLGQGVDIIGEHLYRSIY